MVSNRIRNPGRGDKLRGFDSSISRQFRVFGRVVYGASLENWRWLKGCPWVQIPQHPPNFNISEPHSKRFDYFA